jgi:hypothetical protein
MNENRANANLKPMALAIAALTFLFLVCDSAAAQKRPANSRNAGQLVTLSRIDELKDAFQRDAGKVRFVTILSPT